MAKTPKRSKGSVLLEEFLTERKLTVSDFAARCKSTKSYISMLKLGRVTPGLRLAARIEDAAGIPCGSWMVPAAKAAA
jgi:transcriptional regulator with XRE-family HTH domain